MAMINQYVHLIARAFKGVKSIFLPRFKILCYHSVNNVSRDPYEVCIDNFKQQMTFLAKNGFKVVSLRNALDMVSRNDIGRKIIVITFDDGFASLKDFAFPVLKDFGYPATVFLPVKFIGCIDSFSYKEPRYDMTILDWNDIETSVNYNIEYGSHSMSHKNLVELGDDELEYELDESISILTQRFGYNFQPFAYPFGMFDERVKEAVIRAGYNCSLCFGNVLSNTSETGLFELKREKLLNSTTLVDFSRKINTNYDLFRKVFN
jgi:peptidoglycan/xylan/chitin deacetylase (PgdA/CDA1 family)